MSTAILALLLLAQQAAGLDVMVAVDRDRVTPGDVVTLTVRVASHKADPIRVELPPLGGFELESRAERSDVSTGARPGRTTVVELRLRATAPGEWRLGPVSARQGAAFGQSSSVMVTIEGGSPPPVTANLSPRLARLLQRAEPPGGLDQAGISVAVSDDEVVVGQQVDVVTIAWFDREVRQQLRRAPTVEAPRVEGVWSYPQPVPGGIAASREVGGRWYDLFVLHQVAFPLTPGRVSISAAQLQYSVPLAFQFFSQEQRFKLQSQPARFTVRPLPDAGRPPDYAGAVGHALSVTQRLNPGSGRQGESFTAEVVVRGEGNVALWPQPELRWPASVRVYPEAAEERTMMREGRLAGSKTFRFLLLPDSAGTVPLPALRYAYFDPGSGRYESTTAGGLALVVAPRGEGGGSRAEPPPMRLSGGTPVALAVESALPPGAWWALTLLPIIAFAAVRMPRRRRSGASSSGAADPLAEAERRLDQALRVLVPGAHSTDLPRALRRAGVDARLAEELARLRERLRVARFAPPGPVSADAIVRDVNAAAERLAPHQAGGIARWRRRAGLAALLFGVGLTAGARAAEAQAPPEQLYDAGAYRAAAEGFLRRAQAEPGVPTHWFNLGDAEYRAGADAEALAAWTQGARLAPRDNGLRRALLLVPPADGASGRWLWVSPIAPAELWLVGLVAWFAGWIGLLWHRRLRGRWLVLLAGGLVLLGVGFGLRRYYRLPVAVVTRNAVLRLSPHELAPAIGEVPGLGAVLLSEERGGWYQVEAPGGQRGWIRRDEVAPVARPGES